MLLQLTHLCPGLPQNADSHLGMHRELNAVSSPMQLSVATPTAELLHCTIAVKLPGGLKAPKYFFLCTLFMGNHCTSTLLCYLHVSGQWPPSLISP